MGWKPGQGIGPRLTYRQLKVREKKLKTGNALVVGERGQSNAEEEEDGDFDMNRLNEKGEKGNATKSSTLR